MRNHPSSRSCRQTRPKPLTVFSRSLHTMYLRGGGGLSRSKASASYSEYLASAGVRSAGGRAEAPSRRRPTLQTHIHETSYMRTSVEELCVWISFLCGPRAGGRRAAAAAAARRLPYYRASLAPRTDLRHTTCAIDVLVQMRLGARVLGILVLAAPASGNYEKVFTGIDEIWKSACSQKTPPAGFDGGGYELMYGMFLMPLRALGSKLRLLEIGLGCDMSYGPGSSALLKRNLLPDAQMWEAELDANCVEKHSPMLQQLRITPLVGDQGNRTVLKHWIDQIGDQLDVVIDDGAHTNTAILASFNALWPRVANGGLYFLEDLNVGRLARWDPTHGADVMSDILQAWQEQLTIFRGWGGQTMPRAEGPRR